MLCSYSCITEKKCNERYPPQTITVDSIVYKDRIVEKDSIIHIAGDNVTDTIYLDINDNKIAPIESDKSGNTASVTATGKDNRIIIHSDCKESDIIIKKLRETIENNQKNQSVITKAITVKYIPKVFLYSFWILLVLLVSGLIYLGVKLRG